MRRIEILFGKPLSEVDATNLRGLVTGKVREDADLDFKEQLYGNADADRRELAGDVAAMANTIGGVIVLGIDEVDGAATKLTPVAVSEAEYLRMRQIVASLVAPVPQLNIHRISKTKAARAGFYLIAIPRSPDAPHAVRVNEALKYPRRDGARTRWLSESEVADAYRSRFAQATAQTERLTQIFDEGKAALETDETAWLAIAISPVSPGRMEIRHQTLNDARTNWAGAWIGVGQFGRSVFQAGHLDVSAAIGRVVMAVGRSDGGRSRWGHAELYHDGAGFAAVPLWSFLPGHLQNRDVIQINDERLINAGVSALRFLVEHATSHCGAVGDVIAHAQIVASGSRECWLVWSRQGFSDVYEGSRRVFSFPLSQHQVSLDESQTGQGVMVSARMLLTDLFQHFGLAEVPQINAAGELRRLYFGHDNIRGVEAWAKANGIPITNSKLGEES